MNYPTNYTNLADFKAEVKNNKDLQAAIQDNPLEVMSNVKESPLDTDVWIYRIVVIALGLIILSVTLGVLILVDKYNTTDEKIPAILTSIGAGAIGALTGLLAPSPVQKK